MYGKSYFEKRYGRMADPKFMKLSARLSKLKFPDDGQPTLVVGCGYAQDLMGRRNAVGCDISQAACDFCTENLDLTAFRCAAEVIEKKFGAEKFGNVIMSHVLEHTENPLVALMAARKVLVYGGNLYVAVPTHEAFQGNREDGEYYLWDRLQLCNLLERAGFEIISIKRFSFGGKFIAKNIPSGLGVLASRVAGAYPKHEEIVVHAKKTRLIEIADETYRELTEFYSRQGITSERPVWWKEMAAKSVSLAPLFSNAKRSPILVYCFQHATEKLLPIIRAMYKKGHNVIVLAQDFRARTILKKGGIGFVHLDDFLKVREDFGEHARTDDTKSMVIKTLKQCRTLLEKKRPALVITNIDSLLVGKCLIKTANEMRIQSLLIQHGLQPQQDIPLASQHVAVWGPYFKKLLVAKGIPRRNIHVTGFTNTDEILRYKRDPKNIITFFSQGHALPDEKCLPVYEAAIEYARDTGKLLVFKNHPAESGKLQKRLAVKNRDTARLTKKGYPLYRLLAESDKVLVMPTGINPSTTVLEALIMGVPVAPSPSVKNLIRDYGRMYIRDTRNVARTVMLIEKLAGTKK